MSNFKHSFFRTLLYAQLLSGFSGVAIDSSMSLGFFPVPRSPGCAP